MKMTEIRSLSLEDLKGRIASEQESLEKLKFAHAISPIENPMKIRVARKAVAQLQTELTARQTSNN